MVEHARHLLARDAQQREAQQQAEGVRGRARAARAQRLDALHAAAHLGDDFLDARQREHRLLKGAALDYVRREQRLNVRRLGVANVGQARALGLIVGQVGEQQVEGVGQ